MIKVKAKGNEPAEVLLKKLKKLCEREGVMRDIRRNSFYEKPSVARKRKHYRAIKRKEREERLSRKNKAPSLF